MKQHEAVVEAMRRNGGFATLGYLYQTALKIPDCHWGTKTPFASIRRIVQVHPKLFFKIRPGLWALSAQREEVLEQFSLAGSVSSNKVEEFNHSYYQGLLVQIGNLKNFETFVPHQDKNKLFLSRKLAEISTLRDFHNFTYDSLLKRARTVDVSWFNQRKLPKAFFEIEHTSDFRNSLQKFMEFQDFRIKFRVVADAAKRREFENKIASDFFTPIRREVEFLDYEKLSKWHEETFAIAATEESINI
ncbi:MAG: hypothetical protein QOJ02_3433 [Acidobacteriota bacterium]|jgi:hypothetical protein|nr:hypothetical protein [Acidobacteriota bacterium]